MLGPRKGDRSAVVAELPSPHLAALPAVVEHSLGRVGPLHEPPVVVRKPIGGHRVQFDPLGVEAGVVVDHRPVVAYEPLPVQYVERFCGVPVDDVPDLLCPPVRLSQKALAHAEQHTAPQQREQQQGQGDAVEADTARLHHREFTALGQHAHGDQGGHQRGNRQHEGDVQRRRVPEIFEDRDHGRLAFEQLV